MAGRGRRGVAAGLALLFGREMAKRRRGKAKAAPEPEPGRAEADRLRGELRDELAKRAGRG